MKVVLTVGVIMAVLSGPAFAAGQCASPPKSKWQSTETLKAKLEGEGYKVTRIKTEGGCYEVYATDKAGKRANMAFNALTLDKVDNAEAGEN